MPKKKKLTEKAGVYVPRLPVGSYQQDSGSQDSFHSNLKLGTVSVMPETNGSPNIVATIRRLGFKTPDMCYS